MTTPGRGLSCFCGQPDDRERVHRAHECLPWVSREGRVFTRESWHWGVLRPDFVLVEGMTEDEARAYVERGNADGSTRYSLCRRPVGPWENLTTPASTPSP